MIGTKLAHYEITSHLGTGGMGEVYQATDARLGRSVAIKLLPQVFAQDAERVARFQREARVLASLNHPNIAAIHGLEEANGRNFLVMELVPGETLAKRIARGPIAIDESLTFARQISEALESAHEKGILHRDLKPANIKVTPEGEVKVLDFGLAKVLEDKSADVHSSDSPTMSGTLGGVILGTAAYMSPEQAKGKVVDRRADIWAFGVVLFEMLTGQRMFAAETASETMAAVMMKEPDWNALQANTPARLRDLLRRCLIKEPRGRVQAIGDVRIALEEMLAGPAESLTLPAAARQNRDRLAWIVAALFLLALAGVSTIHFREKPPTLSEQRLMMAVPENSIVHSFAISPDGRHVVFAANVGGKWQLWLRELDSQRAQPMPLTDDASYPFWSPDSRFIGFFAHNKLKRVAVTGGPAQSLCDAPSARGGSWNHDDVIVFSIADRTKPLQRVSAAGGGVPAIVLPSKGDYRHPVFLPDGRRFLYMVRASTPEKDGVFVASLDGAENRRILPDVSGAVFASAVNGGRPGHILFVRENTLMAQAFDAGSAQLAGDVLPVADGVVITSNSSYTPVSVADTGVLLYASGAGGRVLNQFAWYDRAGKFLGAVGDPDAVFDPALSPDEKTLAFRRLATGGSQIWVRDLSRGSERVVTTGPGASIQPVWSPQGDRLAFASNRNGGVYSLFEQPATGGAQAIALLEDGYRSLSTQWSRDGRFLVYDRVDPQGKADLWVLPMGPLEKERKPIAFLQSEANEATGQLSPDGHWMAYTSDESGKEEVYVRPFPRAEGQWPISVAGGKQPRWRGDSKELFFVAADGKIVAVPLKAAAAGPKPQFQAGAPVELFDAHLQPNGVGVMDYEVTADGKRFLIDGIAPGASSAPLNVVVNWNAGPKK